MAASQEGRLDLVRALLRSKPDLNAKQQPNGVTALIASLSHNQQEIVDLLKKCGRYYTLRHLKRECEPER